MNGHIIKIEIQDEKVNEIMERLQKAQEEIRSCYTELIEMGVVVVKKENSVAHTDNGKQLV